MWLLTLSVALAAWPDIDEPLRTGERRPADAAVVIGIEDYPFLTDVPFAKADAEAFRKFLVYTRGVSLQKVQLLDGASDEQMRAAVKTAASQVEDGGVLWIYFAGHGAGHPDTGQRILVGDTAKPDAGSFVAGSVAVAELEELAGASGQQVMLLTDACYNGKGRDGAQFSRQRFAVPTYAEARSDRVSRWVAAGPTELASPLEAAGHGAFTYFAVGALRGWADGELGPKDGEVSLEEAHAYVTRSLVEVGQRDQHPTLDADGAWVLSRSDEAGPDLRGLPQHTAVARAEPGDADITGDLDAVVAQLRAAEQLKARLATERTRAIAEAAEELRERAAETWAKLAPLRDLGGPEATSRVQAFVQRYASAEVEVSDAEGTHTRKVVVPEVEAARGWLSQSVPMRSAPLYQWIEPRQDRLMLKKPVYFKSGKHELMPNSLPLLDEVVTWMAHNPGTTLRVECHTDSIGNDTSNARLSEGRADEVVSYLMKKGATGGRLVAVGRGETQPIDSNHTPEGRARNRRIELHVIR